MVIIGVDQLISNSDLHENRCVENIKKLYNSDGKCDYQQQFKEMIEYAMVYTPEVLLTTVQCNLDHLCL